MRDEEIRQLLENVEVTPSAHCWEAIEGNLAASAGATATTAAKVAGHALSTTAKVIIGTVGAAAVATTVIVLSLSGVFSPKEETTEKQSVAIEDTRTEESVTMVTEVSTPDHTAGPMTETQAVPTQTEIATGRTNSTSDIAAELSVSSDPAPQVAETKAAAAPAPKPSTTAAPTTPAKLSTSPAPKPTTSLSQPQTSSATDLSDPVLGNADVLNDIDFSQPVTLTIPNIITPNGDGANDFFIISGIEQCERNRLIIRNSHGSIVFQTLNYQNNWDAPNLAEGTYFYQFVYTIHGIEETRAGTLTIMR